MNHKRSLFASLLGASLFVSGLISCARIQNVATSQASSQKKTEATACSPASLLTQIEKIAARAGGPVGVSVGLVEGGEVVVLNGQQHFPMQSVYKLPIGMAVLQQIDQGKLKLEQKVSFTPAEFVRIGMHSPIRDKHPRGGELSLAELLRYAVSESDGTASDVLMRTAGGAKVINDYLQGLGINGIMVVDTELEIGKSVEIQYRNWATPEAALALMKVVAEGRSFSPQAQALLLKLITETATGPKRIKGLLPPATVVAHKTGTGLSAGLTRAVNDIGFVTLPNGKHLAIAVFVSDTKLAPEACEAVIAEISRAAWICWTMEGASSP
ncbi:MAG: class A beta-lactamase [Pyrinomonadaceae bacterium]